MNQFRYGTGVFNKIFSRKKTAPQSRTPLVKSDYDIPRYPPFAKGLPAAQTTRIMQTQEELIARIKGTLRFNQCEFKEIVLPVIERYAAYVHLLPASESHHHRGAGGLFRHGLEVGFWAAQRAESHQFCVSDTPLSRRENEPRWQFASFLGGLLHDVGKPLSDVAVTDNTGKREWNPYDSSLAEWSNREMIEFYFLRWRDKRNKRHEKFSMMNLDQIITPKAKSYLNKPGPHIMEALLEAIVGTSASEAITQIVMWADQESVKRDLVNQRLDVDEYAYGVPVERFIFDALRRLVNIAKINEPGAMIWRLEQGVFLAWNQIVPEIHNLIEKDKIPGIPRNPDTLADILIERGFAIPCQESAETKPVRYWRIYPEAIKGVSLHCLRLDDLELIFTNEPPVPVKASFKASPKKDELVTTRAEPLEQTPPIQTNQNSITELTPEKTEDYYSWDQINEVSVPEPPPVMFDETPPIHDAYYHTEPIADTTNQPLNPTEKTAQSKSKLSRVSRLTELASHVDAHVSLSIPSTIKQPSVKQNATKKTTLKVTDKKAQQVQKPSHNNEGTSPGWSLIQIAVKRSSGALPLLEKLPDGDFGIPYPASAQSLGEAREVMNSLYDEGLLRINQTSTSKTAMIAGKKYLVLNHKASRFVAEHLDENSQLEQPLATKTKPISKNNFIEHTPPTKSTPPPEKAKNRRLIKNADRKLPSQEEFGEELIEQIIQGFGAFIAGDVQVIKLKEGMVIYQVPIDSIQAMAVSLNTTPTAIRTLVRKTPSVNIRVDHDKGDFIEYIREA